MDKKIIKTRHDTLEVYINAFGHITLKVEEITPSHTIDMDGEWTDDEYAEAGISLDKDRAVELNTALSFFIKNMFPGSGREFIQQQVKSSNLSQNDTTNIP